MLAFDYVKMHGLQNSFVVINDFGGYFSSKNFLDSYSGTLADLASVICHHHTGIGSDGLVLLGSVAQGQSNDFKMTVLNRDGSIPEMCGNAIRCLAKYVIDEGWYPAKKKSTSNSTGFNSAGHPAPSFETPAGSIYTEVLENSTLNARVRVNMGSPIFEHQDFPSVKVGTKLEVGDREMDCVSMGNPHAVIEVEDFDFDYRKASEIIQNNSAFPNGVNVEWVRKVEDGLDVRVVERGVGETQACGTGACAVGVIDIVKESISNPDCTHRTRQVHLMGGDLEIEYDQDNDRVFMTGDACLVASGTFYLPTS